METLIEFIKLRESVSDPDSRECLEVQQKMLFGDRTPPHTNDRHWNIVEALTESLSLVIEQIPPTADCSYFSVSQRTTLDKCIAFIIASDFKSLSVNYKNLLPGMALLLKIMQINTQVQLTKHIDGVVFRLLVLILGLKFKRIPAEESEIETMFSSFEDIVTPEQYIQALLIIMGFPNPPIETRQGRDWMHKQLMKLVTERQNGLRALCSCLLKGEDNETVSLWQKCSAVARIVSGIAPNVNTLYGQLEELFQASVAQKDERLIASCIACFNELIDHGRPEIDTEVRRILAINRWMQLSNPEDLLAGLCVLDEAEVLRMIEINFVAFRGSKLSSVKSKVVQPIIPLLFQFSVLLRKDSKAHKQLQDIVIHGMANRKPEELKEIVERILFPITENPSSTQGQLCLHPRIGVKYAPGGENFQVIIRPVEESEEDKRKVADFPLEFVNLLKNSNNNLLIFNVFMGLLKVFEDVMSEEEGQIQHPLADTEDAEIFVGRAFQRKSVTICTLAELIAYKPFHFQFTENPTEILQFIRKLLQRKTENLTPTDEPVLVLIFSLFREFISGQTERFAEEVKKIQELARSLRANCDGMDELRAQIDFFLNEWSDREDGGKKNEGLSAFGLARELCRNEEPYLRVYGMRETMKLIRTRDAETMANLHEVLLGALVYIKDEDSYSFLTSIQLLVLLTRHLEGTVVETLVAEFQDTTMSMDYRLKIGEAIVKTVEGLGVFAVKYKEMLINCFLCGVTEKSNLDEYRVTCIFNLGQICKLLTFQVHGFFNEMVSCLKMVLEQDAYLPARRSAALLLVDLLRGMENLVDYQEFLLPVYRLLKSISETDADEKTRVHANAGLQCLSEKIKEALTPVQALEKEIRILGIETEKEKQIVFPK